MSYSKDYRKRTIEYRQTGHTLEETGDLGKKDDLLSEAGSAKIAAYQEQIKDIPPEKIVYVDECGIDTYLYREYGY